MASDGTKAAGRPRRTSAVLFYAILIAVLLCGHGYIARGLILDTGLSGSWRAALLAAVALGFGMLMLEFFFARRLSRPLARALAWPSYIWLGFAFLLNVALGISDALLWLVGGLVLAAPGAEAASRAADLRAAAVLALALVAAAFALRGGLRAPQLRRVDLALPRWPHSLDGFRIVQISDLHIGSLRGRRFARALVERIAALDPDLVVVTGDLVDGSVARLAEEVSPLAALRARHGVFFVTGNHDHYSGATGWVEQVRGMGIRPLRNERVEIEAGGAIFDLIGVDDPRGSLFHQDGGEDLESALAGRQEARPGILLAHDPATFARARGRGIDLQLSGHTHGGQIWPFRYVVRLVTPFVAGCYRAGQAQLYVSRGTGSWGPPMRLFAPAEITQLTLQGA